MEKTIHQLMVTALFLVVAILASGSALAQVHDCSGGCWIVTCNGNQCTLWRCDSDGCRDVSNFEKEEIQSNVTSGQQSFQQSKSKPVESRSGIDCGDQRCAVKVCGPLQCSIFGFDNGQSILLGSHDNVDAILNEIGMDFLEKRPGKSVTD